MTKLVQILLTKELVVNLGKDGNGQQNTVTLPAGVQEVAAEIAEHWFVKAHSQEITQTVVVNILEAVQKLTSQEVLVGIPHGEARSDADMTNAQIGYIQETGSPAMNLPARAFLAPGVEDCQEQTSVQLTKAIDQALAGNSQGVDRCLNRAGMIAQNSVRAKINTGDFEPLSAFGIRLVRYQKQLNRLWLNALNLLNGMVWYSLMI